MVDMQMIMTMFNKNCLHIIKVKIKIDLNRWPLSFGRLMILNHFTVKYKLRCDMSINIDACMTVAAAVANDRLPVTLLNIYMRHKCFVHMFID